MTMFVNGLATRWQSFEDIFIRFGAIHERDGHRVTAYTALMHTHRAVKLASHVRILGNE